MGIGRRIVSALLRIAERRPPDFVIGTSERPYLLRWWLIPRNPIANIYLHWFWRSDDDRACHDHPWPNVSILLRGEYLEHVLAPGASEARIIRRRAGNVVFRGARARHRIELHRGKAWSLFVTGPRLRNWGFWCGERFVPWQVFTAPGAPGEVGRGCE